MTQGQFKSLRNVAGAACGLWALSFPAMGQEEPGDQILSFGVSQKFSANDNIRLDPTSVGTTYSSDTKLSFGFSSQTQTQTFDVSASGVLRLVDDPIIGTDSGFRDPSLALFYSRDSANSRLTLTASYERPDLAFLDPLTQDTISDQDLYRGGGTRENYEVGALLETGLYSPLGFEFDLHSQGRLYSDTTDPLLFANRTDTAAVATLFRLSPVTQARLDLSDEHYTAKDISRTDRTTREFTFGLDHEFSAVTSLSANIGHSEVVETFDNRPGIRNVTRGPVGAVSLMRLLPNGSVSVALDTDISTVGRQTTLEFGRFIDLPAGQLAFSFGATQGSGFNLLPIGSIDYFADLPTGSINASLSRSVNISSTLSRAETTTRVDLGYLFEVNDISSLSFNLYYADISLTGFGATGPGRERGSFYATYTRDITQDWDITAGYEYRYYDSSSEAPANSNTLFVALKRDFDMFR